MSSDNGKPQTTKRMVSAEQKAYLDMLASISQLAFAEEGLARRIESIPRGKSLLHGGRGMLVKLGNELANTLPPEQREHFRRQLPALRMIVGVKAQMPRAADGEHGRWLSFKQLDVVATAIRECCRTCTIDDPQQQKQCMYAKLLDVLPTDKPDENATGCGYFSIW